MQKLKIFKIATKYIEPVRMLSNPVNPCKINGFRVDDFILQNFIKLVYDIYIKRCRQVINPQNPLLCEHIVVLGL